MGLPPAAQTPDPLHLTQATPRPPPPCVICSSAEGLGATGAPWARGLMACGATADGALLGAGGRSRARRGSGEQHTEPGRGRTCAAAAPTQWGERGQWAWPGARRRKGPIISCSFRKVRRSTGWPSRRPGREAARGCPLLAERPRDWAAGRGFWPVEQAVPCWGEGSVQSTSPRLSSAFRGEERACCGLGVHRRAGAVRSCQGGGRGEAGAGGGGRGQSCFQR